jgi:hypothetical protein
MFALLVSLVGVGRALATAQVGTPEANQVKQRADDVEPPGALSTGIPIYPSQDAARSNPLVVYSVHAPNLSPGETVRIDGSNHTSYCTSADINPATGNPGSPCKGLTGGSAPDPYTYTVHVEIHAYQASSPTATSGGQPSGWLADATRLCTWDFHHCAFTVKNEVTGLSAANGQYINQEVTAWTDSPDWESGQMMELEGNCINGTGYANCDPQPNDDQATLSKGQLSVIRIGSNYSGSVPIPTGPEFSQPYIEINTSGHYHKQVVYSRPVHDLRAGDTIEVSGGMQLDGTQPCAPDDCTLNGSPDPTYAFQHAVVGYWLLATSPADKVAGTGGRYVSATDIQNCQSEDGTVDGLCRLQMLGAVTAPAPPADHTMYLNFVAWAFDNSDEKPSTNGVTPKVQLSAGQFDAIRYPATTPAARYPTHFTRFKFIARSSGGTFKGRISASTSKCVRGRSVKVIRRHHGGHHTVGQDRTGAAGKFAIKLSASRARNGRYYARVTKKKLRSGEGVCEAERSRSIRISS